jgi:hypothetical protein
MPTCHVLHTKRVVIQREQRLHNVAVARLDRQVQRSIALDVCQSWIRPRCEQLCYKLQLATLTSLV